MNEDLGREERNANLLIGMDCSADREINVPSSAMSEDQGREERNANLPIGRDCVADQEINVPRSAMSEDQGREERNANLLIGMDCSADREIAVPSGVPVDDPSSSSWHSRGYLPHFDGQEEIQHVTFHLADSLPKEVFARLHEEVEHLPETERKLGLTTRVQNWMDVGHGSCVLREPDVAAMMEGVLLFFDNERYVLFEWVIMPNHVHVLFKPLQGWDVSKIVASWKKFSGRKISDRNANLPIGMHPSSVWHREYWDRYMRDDAHFYRTAEYIRDNPVKAGLVERADQWMWGSARSRADR